MANTIMSAKNSFEQGLIMDFSPDNTQANCLTSALNATLLTFNGNEMQLQNDMGNGRVETAYLPEGYVPVGTCEFGDIVYIVSYNPLINKSQIGCFPSPERNISSEEIGGLQQSLQNSDFIDGNGKIKNKSVKKILYNRTMNPGDKYIIYSSYVDGNSSKLSDYGSLSETHDSFPKLVKLHIVAIEDSGKINYLDSSVKWYDNNYYISDKKIGSDAQVDIDEYRDLVTSNYSIFQSKVPGKLAILAELESIDSFNCSYTIDTTANNNDDTKNYTKNYTVNFNVSWETKNKNINPNGIIITESTWPFATKKETEEGIQDIIKYTTPNGDEDYEINYNGCSVPLLRTYEPELFESRLKEIHGYDFNDFFKCFLEEYNYDTVIKEYTNYRHILPTSAGSEDYYVNPDVYDSGVYYTLNNNGTRLKSATKSIKDDIVNNYFHKEVIKPTITLENVPYKTKTDKGDKSYYHDLSNFVWNYTVAPTMPYGILEDMAVSGSIDFSKIGSGIVDLVEWRYYNDGNITTLKWGLEAYPDDNKKITKVAFEFYDNQGVVGTYVIKDKVSFSGSFTETIQLGPDGVNPKLLPEDKNGSKVTHNGELYVSTEKLDLKNIEGLIQSSEEPGSNNEYYYTNDAGILYPNLAYIVKIYVYEAEIDALGNIKGEESQIGDPFIRCFWTNNLMNSYYYNNTDFVGITPELTYSLDVSFQSNDSFSLPAPENDPKKYILNNQSKTPADADKDGTASVEEVVKATLGGIKQVVDTTGGHNLSMSVVPCLDNSYNTFTFGKDNLANLNYTLDFKDSNIQYSPVELIFSDSQVTGADAVKPKYNEKAKQNFDLENLDDWFTLIPDSNIITADQAMIYDGSQGIPLTLKGQMVSKIAGSIYGKKNIDAIVYRPIIATPDDFGEYNMKYATDQGTNPIIFANCAAVGIAGDDNPVLELGSAEGDGTWGAFNLDEESNRVRIGYNPGLFTSMDLGKLFKDNNLDFDHFSIVTFYSSGKEFDTFKDSNLGDSHRDGHFDLRSSASANSTKTIKKDWKDFWKTYNNSDFILKTPAGGDVKEDEGKRWTAGKINSVEDFDSLNALIVKTTSGRYIMFNNFHRSPKNGHISQQFAKTIGDYPTRVHTFAQLIASLLVKIYYRSDITEQIPINTTSNIITCNDYTATWTKDIDIIVSPKDTEDTEEAKEISGKDFIIMSGLDYSDYYDELADKAGLKSDDIINDKYLNNLNINLSLEKTHSVQFQYSLKYNIDYLQKLYNTQEIKYYIQEDIVSYTKSAANPYPGGPTNTPPFSGTLGFLQGNEFIPLNQVKKVPIIYCASYTSEETKFANLNETNKINDISISKEILNNLTFENGKLILRDFSYNREANMFAIAGNTDNSENDTSFALTNKAFFDESKFKII